MDKNELALKVYQIAHLQGQFKLRSGQISNEYFDKYRFESNPLILREIAKALVPLIPEGTEVLAGLELGGVPIATALSLETGIPTAFVRKKAKDYGTCLIAEGSPLKNKKVCIIEDVVTTGGQVLLSAADIRNAGAHLTDALCVIYRGPDQLPEFDKQGLHLKSLFKFDKSEGRLKP